MSDPKPKSFPVSLEFDTSRVPLGFVTLDGPGAATPNLHEYFLAPEYSADPDTKEIMVTGFGLIHRSHLPTEAVMKRREKDAGIS